MIESPEDAAKALLRKRSGNAMRDFRLSVRPIYALVSGMPKPVLKHAGTCILLNVDGHRVLSTAAHVLDPLKKGVPLFVGGPVGTHPVQIMDGLIRTTTPPQGARNLDHLDYGFWKMPEGAVQALGGVEFIDASRISLNRAPADRRYYMAMGYPLSRNKDAISQSAGTIGNRLSRYSGSVVKIPKLAAKLRISGTEHMFLRFEKQAFTEDDGRVNAFGPKGLSGGPLLDLGDFTLEHAYTADATHRAALSGMLIEHHQEHRAMVAVKIGPIVRRIRRWLRGSS